MKRPKVHLHTMFPSFRLALYAVFGLWALSSTPIRAAMPDVDFVALCETGTAAEVEQALKNGVNANAKDADGFSALGMAATREDGDQAVPVIRALLAAGAAVNGPDRDGDTALMKAVEYRSGIRVVQALLDAGANPNVRNRYGSTPLREASGYAQNLPVVQALLAAGAQVDARNGNDGCTALARAAQRHNDASMVQTLLDAGADANARCRDGPTPVLEAAVFSGPEPVTILLEAGADKSMKDDNGHDALWHARHGAENDCGGIKDPAACKARNEKITALLQGGAAKPLPTLSVYVSDPAGTPTNVRSAPGGAMAGTLTADGDYLVRLIRCEKGWCQAIAIDTVDQGPVQIQSPGGELWLHASVLAFSTRNYGGQTLALRQEPDKEATPLFSFADEQMLRPLDFRAVGGTLWVQAETFDKKHRGWLEAEWVCGNPVTSCP